MDLSTGLLFAVVVLLAANQLVMRSRRLYGNPAIFFGLLAVELLAGSAILVLGMPGFEDTPGVTWVLGLMFFLHVAQNLNLRQRRMASDVASDAEALRERAAQIRARLVDADESHEG